MTEQCRNEARSVILRLRRYRDRMQHIVATADGNAHAIGSEAIVLRRRIRSLTSDLANDAHECVIGRKRLVQTECEHEFLWPALREAADAISEKPGMAAIDVLTSGGLSTAQGRIQHYLTQLEGRWPTF